MAADLGTGTGPLRGPERRRPNGLVLRASHLGKRYELGPARVRRVLGHLRREDDHHEHPNSFWALRDVSFTLARGASLGVVGRNGAGKSTMLRLLAGTARPTEGTAEAFAPLACLLDLGAGFSGLESGRQNAETLLVLQAGLSRREARERMPEVEAFAEIGEFFDRPIRTYSDGMRLRLAFATLTLLEPEVMITDEILVVGDEAFQRKCSRWFEAFLGRGGSLVLCAHDLAQVQRLCGQTLWLDHGRVVESGESREVIRHYREAVGGASAGGAEGGGDSGTTHAVGQSAGLPFEVVDLQLRDASGTPSRLLPPGATVDVVVDIHAPGGTPQVHVGITRDDLTPVFGVSSDMDDATPSAVGEGRHRYELRFEELPLTAGSYRLRAHALDETGTRLYDTVEIDFAVAGDDDPGLVRLPAEWHPDEE